MKWLMLYCFWSITAWCCAQTLPGYKNGSWWIISNGKLKQLSTSVTHLGNFDEYNRAVFIENNLYGIMGENGRIDLEPKLYAITGLGNGLFECSDSTGTFLFDVLTNEKLFHNVEEIISINNAYSMVRQKDSSMTILFLEDRTQFQYKDTLEILSSNLNTVFLEERDSEYVFFSAEGKRYIIPTADVQLYTDKIVYTIDNKTTLITPKIIRTFTEDPHILILGNYISFYEKGRAHLLNSETGIIEKTAPFEQISPAFFGGFYVTKNRKTGWMNENGVIKIPAIYDQIYKNGKDYIVTNSELRGQYNEVFKLTVPVAFYSYYFRNDLLYTTSILGYNGIYSLIQNKTILEPIYNRISTSNTLIKGYYKNNIRVIELSEQHTIKSDIILENTTTVRQSEFSPYDSNHRYDKRLLSLGWFFQRFEGGPKLSYIWGLKTDEDSILIRPRLKEPIFIPNRHFSLVLEKERTISSLAYYKMRSYSSGKQVNNLSIIGIDTIDCSFRYYARTYTKDGYKILLPNDSVKTVNYVGYRYGKYVPYCIGEKIEYSNKSEQEYVPINYYLSNGSFNNLNLAGVPFYEKHRNKYKYQKFTDAKWNYLDSLGNDLFPESFEFAQEFVNDRAIVKKNGAWGVVSKDTITIPFNFSEIKRIPELGDSVFLVKKNRGGKDLLDSTATSLGMNISRIVKSKGNLTVVSKGTEQFIFRNNQLENKSSSSIIILGNNEYALKEKKEYKIIDESGQEVGASSFKPIKIIGNQLLIIEDKSKVGLANLHGDIIYTPSNFTFERIGIFILKRGNSTHEILNDEGVKFLSFDIDQQLLIDSITNTIAHIKNSKAELYDRNGKNIGKIKLISKNQITDYYAGHLFSVSNIQSKNSSLTLEKDIVFKFFRNGYFAIFSSGNQIDMYKNGLNQKIFSCQAKKIYEIGAGIFSYQTSTGLIIRNDESEKEFPLYTQVQENFTDNYCLLRTNKVYFFIDSSLENPFHRTFLDATSFQHNYATIKYMSGWTILEKSGIAKAYPSFDKITQLGNGLFETAQKPQYGVIDKNGKEIVPCNFEKIEILPKGIIKVFKMGEIGYYDQKGVPIFELLRD